MIRKSESINRKTLGEEVITYTNRKGIETEVKVLNSVLFTDKEKRELEELEKQMPLLEEEKAQLEALLSGGATLPDEIAKASARYKEVQEALDEAEMRWLELSEIE